MRLAPTLVLSALLAVPAVARAQGDAPPPLPPGDAKQPDASPAEPSPDATPAPLPPPPAPPPRARWRSRAPASPEPTSPGAMRVYPPPQAPPPAYTPPAVPDAPAPEGPPRISWVRLGLGTRLGYIPHEGFDAYATNDVLAQISLEGSVTLLERRPWSLAGGLAVDLGGRSSRIRNEVDASLFAMRVTVPIEARWHLAGWLYAFGKLAPGVAYNAVSFKDPAALTPLRDKGGAFAADASLGASVMIGGYKNLDKPGVRFWVTPEVGYGFTTTMRVRPNADRDEDDVTGTEMDASFRSLALRGGFWKLGVGFTF